MENWDSMIPNWELSMKNGEFLIKTRDLTMGNGDLVYLTMGNRDLNQQEWSWPWISGGFRNQQVVDFTNGNGAWYSAVAPLS